MTDVIVTLKVMPKSPETDLNAVKDQANGLIEEFGGKLHQSEEQPVAFGLKALMLTLIVQEEGGSTDDLEEKIAALADVESVSVTSVSRALG